MDRFVPLSFRGVMRECVICGVPFQIKARNQQLCSQKCRAEWQSRRATYEIPSGSVGAIAEMAVCAELLKRGYCVFRSVSPSSFCDVVAIKGSEAMHLEVRNGYQSPSGVLTYPKILHAKIAMPTHYAVFVASTSQVHLIPVSADHIEKYAKYE